MGQVLLVHLHLKFETLHMRVSIVYSIKVLSLLLAHVL